jgi:hypothetical protein
MKKIKNHDECAGNEDLFVHGKIKKMKFFNDYQPFFVLVVPCMLFGFLHDRISL